MFLSDVLYETYVSLTANKVRSGLTVLGIVIGIASVIAMVAIGNGAQISIEKNIQMIGSNLLMIRPGSQSGPGQSVSQGQGSAQTLSLEDVDAIRENVSLVESVVPTISKNFQVIANGKNTRTSLIGTISEYSTVRNISLSEGVYLNSDHEHRSAKVVVLGPDVRDELFGSGISAVGKKVRINGIDFIVIGVSAPKGGSGFSNEDDVAYVPLSTARQYLVGSTAGLSLINIKVRSADSMTAAEEAIRQILLKTHGIQKTDEADFRVMNQGDIVETASSITGTFTLLLGAVAGISLVVGGIGIMNMMLTSVTERTREIGLRKAIGARRVDISMQFLLEAFALTVIGGIIGIIIGWLLASIFQAIAGIETSISLSSVALAFSVSAGIGIIFGWYPARRAARLHPIEALRYE